MLRWFLAVFLILFADVAPVGAQDKPVHYSQCQAIAQAFPGATYARFDLGSASAPMLSNTAVAAAKVRITFIGHSTFYIETPAGVTIATDYNGYISPPALPMVATMNHAHSTHYTLIPDPAIGHVLHGWSDDPSSKPDYRLVVRDTFIRNVTTDIRGYGGGMAKDGNSIFIFEVAGLCIGHLGHLHEELSEGQYAEVGRIDVLMVSVDGGLTMGPVGMSHVVQRLKASLILPMHMPNAIPQFLAMFGAGFEIKLAPTNTIEVSLDTLPKKPEILILKGMR